MGQLVCCIASLFLGDASTAGPDAVVVSNVYECLDGQRELKNVRLKAYRRGFQDYEYFWLLAQSGRRVGPRNIGRRMR